MTTIALSIERILESVYAHSASNQFVSDSPRPIVLGRQNEAMLRRMARDVLAADIFTLIPAVKGTNLLTEPDSDIVTIDMAHPDTVPAETLRVAMEVCVATGILASVYADADSALSATYGAAHTEALASLRRRAAMGIPDRIVPSA